MRHLYLAAAGAFALAVAPTPVWAQHQHMPGMQMPPAGEPAALERWKAWADTHLADYATGRDRPDLDTTSRMSVHLKWGEIHPRTMLADIAARRAFAPTELPVGIVTGIIGAPYLLWLLARANRIGAGG